ncbi:hypothetical protein LguiA_013842 [Lonicera macranthoides]
MIASRIPWKSIEDIKKHYDDLVYDVNMIEADLIEPPKYKDDVDDSYNFKASDNNQSESETETEKEKEKEEIKESSMMAKALAEGPSHRDWRSISRFYVKTKTPTQVASHAQKYFRRQQNKTPAERRRPSIHDIQSVNATYVAFPSRHRNPPEPQKSPPLSDLVPNSTHPPPPPTIYPTYPETYNAGEMPTGVPSGGPAFLPQTEGFPLDDLTLMPMIDPLFDTTYPSPYMFPPSTSP